MRGAISRTFLSPEVGAAGIVLVLAYLVLSETTLALQDDRPAIKKRLVVAETLTLNGPNRAGTGSLAIGSGAELSFLKFASPDGVNNLRMVLVRGDPIVVFGDAQRRVSLFINATQDGSLLSLNHDDDRKRRLEVFCGRAASRIILRERGGGAGFLVEDGAPAPSSFLNLAPPGLNSDSLSLYANGTMTGFSVCDSFGKQRTSMRLVLKSGFAGVGFYDRAERSRLSIGVVRSLDAMIRIMDRGGRVLQSVP